MRDKQKVSHIIFVQSIILETLHLKKLKYFQFFRIEEHVAKKIGQRKVKLLNSDYPKTLQLFRIVQTIVTTKLQHTYQF